MGVRREISDLMRNGWKKGYGIFKLSFKRLKSYKRIDIFLCVDHSKERNKQTNKRPQTTQTCISERNHENETGSMLKPSSWQSSFLKKLPNTDNEISSLKLHTCVCFIENNDFWKVINHHVYILEAIWHQSQKEKF